MPDPDLAHSTGLPGRTSDRSAGCGLDRPKHPGPPQSTGPGQVEIRSNGKVVQQAHHWLSEDPHLAGLLGGLFGAFGATAKGYNENRQMSQPDPAPVTPPRAGEPPRDVAPEGDTTTREEPSTDTQSSVQAGRPATAVAEPRDGDPNIGAMTGNLGPMTFAELKEMVDALFGLPEYVIAATQALTNQGVAPTSETAALLQIFVQATPPGTGALGGDAGDDFPAGSADQGETPEAEATVSTGPEEPAAGDQVSGGDGMSYLEQPQGEGGGDMGAIGDDGMSYLEQPSEGSGQEASTGDDGGGDAAVVVDQ